MGMVAWVHRRATYLWATTLPAITTSLTNTNILMIDIADLAKRGYTIYVYHSHFTRRHT